jgi:hypothetical protein
MELHAHLHFMVISCLPGFFKIFPIYLVHETESHP